jgi:hypothetical protein
MLFKCVLFIQDSGNPFTCNQFIHNQNLLAKKSLLLKFPVKHDFDGVNVFIKNFKGII